MDRCAVPKLLIHYEVLCRVTTRADALEMLADLENFGGENRAKKIEEKITEGRKRIPAGDLEYFISPPDSRK